MMKCLVVDMDQELRVFYQLSAFYVSDNEEKLNTEAEQTWFEAGCHDGNMYKGRTAEVLFVDRPRQLPK